MADELSSPLGKKKRNKFNLRLSNGVQDWPVGGILFAISGLIIAGFILRIVLVNDPTGGQPVIEVPISSTINSNSVAEQISTPAEIAPVIISKPDGVTEPGPIDPDDLPNLSEEDKRDDFGNFVELSEQTQNGPIPRIGVDGRTPFKTYARASIGQEVAAGKPLIAIIVTGMGLNQSATMEAISILPDNITLAFAPYSRTLANTTAAARAGGHEILLEIPMEPFDYPNSDPGPHTLLTGYPARANLDRLFWLMARAGGYVGVINNMGAKFTSSATDLGPFMEELGSRGIGYLDDGSSNRSVSRQLAVANQVPFARASLALDVNPSRSAILSQLQNLVALAQEQGQAIGVISALPISINTLSSWASQVEEMGILMVPASALMKVQN